MMLKGYLKKKKTKTKQKDKQTKKHKKQFYKKKQNKKQKKKQPYWVSAQTVISHAYKVSFQSNILVVLDN